MVKQVIVYWRDIPAQIILQRGRKREKFMLTHRFQTAIDRAAMRAGKGSSDAYLSEWRRDRSSFDNKDPLERIAKRKAADFETTFTDEKLEQMVRNKGLAH